MTSTPRIPPCNALSDIEMEGDQININADETPATKEQNTVVDILPKSDESNGTRTSTEILIDDESNSDNNESTMNKWYCSLKFYVGLLLLGFVIYVIIDSVTNKYVRDGLESFLQWIEENPLSGFFLFVIVYIVATLLFIPGSLLTLGAGFVFSMALHGLGVGVVVATLSVVIGASIGAILAFVLGRYLLLEQVRKLSKKYAIFEALNVALETNGLKIFILLRLSPIIPFSALNYLAGALSVSLRDYLLSLFAIIPGTVLYVFLGASAGSLADSSSSGSSNTTVTIVVVVAGVVLGVLAIYLTTRYARKELHRIIEERQNLESDTTGALDVVDATPESAQNKDNIDVDDVEAPPERSSEDI